MLGLKSGSGSRNRLIKTIIGILDRDAGGRSASPHMILAIMKLIGVEDPNRKQVVENA